MTVKAKAFIALENTFAAILMADVQTIARKAHKSIGKHLKAKNYQDAYSEAKSFSLKGVTDKKRKRLREIGVSALVFGQQQLLPSNLTALVSGKMKVPEQLDMAINQYKITIEDDLEDRLRKEFTRMVDNYNADDDLTPMSKADFSIVADDLVAGVVQSGVNARANLVTSRLVSYGFLSQAEELSVTHYQISEILDNLTCPVCQHMHGQTFEVSSEMSRLDSTLRTLDPNELKSLAPWPSQTKNGLKVLFKMSPGDMQNSGFGSPPFHPCCRGILVATGTTKLHEPSGVKQQLLQEIEDELVAMFMKPVDTGLGEAVVVETAVAPWHMNIEGIGSATSEHIEKIKAMTSGLTEIDFKKAVLGDDNYSTSFIEYKGTRLRIAGLSGDSVVSIDRSIYIDKLEASHSYFQLKSDAQGSGVAKKVLGSAIPLYERLGITKVKILANIDVGGYAWAKYGFKMDSAEWEFFADSVQQRFDSPDDILFGLAVEDKEAILAILSSKDTKALWALADSKYGKAVLLKSNWSGALDLTDTESMARFNAYVGK